MAHADADNRKRAADPPGHAQLPKAGLHEIALIEMAIAQIFGELAEFWGLPPTQGRIYGLLFATPGPLDQSSIRKRLSISVGSTSMSLQALVNWGVVTQDGRSYRAQPDLYRAVTSVLHRRERAQADRTLHKLKHLLDRLSDLSQLQNAPPELHQQQQFLLQRIEHLQAIFGLGRTLIDAFVQKNPMQNIVRTMAQRAARLVPIVSRSQPYV